MAARRSRALSAHAASAPGFRSLVAKENTMTLQLRTLLICTCWCSPGGTARAADAPADPIAAAIGSADRTADDRSQDATRQPAAVLGFLAVKPGWHVLDVFSAAGYYTELLSRIVGPTGEVVAYNNPPYAAFAAKGIGERYAGNRLPKVRQIP